MVREYCELGDEELIEEYEQICIFRGEERAFGQVTPHLMKKREMLRKEITQRMKMSDSKDNENE